MGNSLEQFTVNLEFDDEGDLSSIAYFDEKGCGQIAPQFDETDSLKDLVAFHVNHYASDHNIEPRIRCSFTAKVNEAALRCDEEDDHAGDHRFSIPQTADKGRW